MNLSYNEKSLWLMLVGLVGTFGVYFVAVVPARSPDVMPHQVVWFLLAVGALVIMQVVGHIVVAIGDRRAESDERDRLIELKATRIAAYVLATGVFFSLCAAIAIPGNFVFTHVLLAFWVSAQVVEIGSQLFMHRRGV